MNRARLRFSTEIIRRLGEELNPSLDKGVVELVKNAYDADATECCVELLSTEGAGGTVLVSDNGDGMTVDEIISGWLVLGRSSKSQGRRTRLGRVPAGSKGLGRLAALRMGRRALLTTRPRGEEGREYRLEIDWRRFDAADVVEDVVLEIKDGTSDHARSPHGTEIRVEELRTGFGRMTVKRLARDLILLADPFQDDPQGFRPELRTSEFADLEDLVRGGYFRDAEFFLRAELDAEGRASARVTDWRGATLYQAEHGDLTRDKGVTRRYKSPRAAFELWVFLLNRQTFSARSSSIGEVRRWLREFGGVHLYYNGLRVDPYGNVGNDWLEMNLRRARSPEEKPSTNTSIGRVSVVDEDDVLEQKTDRSGFIEDTVFADLRAFAQDALDWMARRRLDEAERRRAQERVAAPIRSGESELELSRAIKSSPPRIRGRLETAFERYEATHKREVESLHREVQLYRTLSTAGITAVTFAHESSGSSVKVISQSLGTVARRARGRMGTAYDELLREPVQRIRRAVRNLAALGAATLRLVAHEKRRLSRIDLHGLVAAVLDNYKPFLTARDVRMKVELASSAPYLRGSEAAIESIVTNLLTNSVAAFEENATRNRTIRVRSDVADRIWTLTVEDNGPGIHGISKREIWLPGRTTRRDGTGLGLTIVRDAVRDLGGHVDAFESGELGGAVLVVELPVLGVVPP